MIRNNIIRDLVLRTFHGIDVLTLSKGNLKTRIIQLPSSNVVITQDNLKGKQCNGSRRLHICVNMDLHVHQNQVKMINKTERGSVRYVKSKDVNVISLYVNFNIRIVALHVYLTHILSTQTKKILFVMG